MAYPWQSSWQRCAVLKELGHEVIEFHQEYYHGGTSFGRRLMRRLIRRPFESKRIRRFNDDLFRALRDVQPQIAWFEWPQMLLAETLEAAKKNLPNCLFLSFQDDNPFGLRENEARRWKYFLEAIPLYDLHFVKRRSDIKEYKDRGARHVEIFMGGFYDKIFHPLPDGSIPARYRHEVVFVGTPHDRRVGMIQGLIRRHKIPLHVYGNSWNKTLVYHLEKKHFHPAVLCEEYVQVIAGSRISLGFVSSSNRDEYTMRTFEIPACKGFLLAERTPVHQELYEEGKEAEFFSSIEECADKIRHYLSSESARKDIAEAGYRRCLLSGYSLKRRLSDAIERLNRIIS